MTTNASTKTSQLDESQTGHIEIEVEIEELRRQHKKISERVRAMEALQDVARSLTSELLLEPLLHKILASAVQVMGASAGSLLLLDPDTDELIFSVIEGGGGEALLGQRMPRDKGVAGWVSSNLKPLIVNDVNMDNRYYQTIAEEVHYKTTSLISVPMLAKGELIGVLQVLNKRSGEQFDENDQDVLMTFGAQSAIAIENARLYEDLRAEKDRILAVEEEVRKELARDLHDGPAQMLAAILMSLEFVGKLMEKRPEKTHEELEKTGQLAQRALKQVRTLLFDLRPVILETQGLVPALESYACRLEEVEGLNVVLTVEGEFPRPSSRAEGVIFAIVQEAITNAKKHAKASRHDIRLHYHDQDDTLEVVIEDNGVGFDLAAVDRTYDQRSSLGLLNMRERASVIKGDLTIKSSPGKGTVIRMTLPISANLPEPEAC